MAAAAAPAETRAEIIEQTRRMNRLVAELLDYAKPWKIEPADIDLAAAFGNVETHIASDAHLRADPFRFAQAMDNLIANARAAGGRVAIFVEATREATLVHVCDDGPGVPEDIKDRLFHPFVSRSSEGTGLGLAIVAKIMAAHGGAVALGAREGFSTCVTLRFPK
jgi:signal transduction histidine kinase